MLLLYLLQIKVLLTLKTWSNAVIVKLIDLDMQVIVTEWKISFSFVLLLNPTRSGLFSGNCRVGGGQFDSIPNLPPKGENIEKCMFNASLNSNEYI